MLMVVNKTEEVKPILTPSLIKLLESSIILNSTNSKVIANHLTLSHGTIRTQFQRVLAILEVTSRYAAIRKFEEIINKDSDKRKN